MRISRPAVIVTLILSSATLATVAHAGGKSGSGGASASSPGHQMQNHTGPSTEHGASQYAPGDLKHDSQSSTTFTPPGKLPDPGASGFAPGDKISKGKK